jgi:alkylated DNA repair dioxygenase AlkB
MTNQMTNQTTPSYQVIRLSDESYLLISKLPEHLINYTNEYFDKMYSLRPEISKVLVGPEKNEVITERRHASYLNTPSLVLDTEKSYMFSGMDTSNNNQDLPEIFKPLMKYMNEKRDDSKFPKFPEYNQVVVNWYENGNEYIPFHSDCETGFADNANVAIISLGSTRTFELVKKTPLQETTSLPCEHGTIIYMCGDTQKQFRHGIRKDECEGRRISISFRSFA